MGEIKTFQKCYLQFFFGHCATIVHHTDVHHGLASLSLGQMTVQAAQVELEVLVQARHLVEGEFVIGKDHTPNENTCPVGEKTKINDQFYNVIWFESL